MKESAKRIAQEREKREKESVKEENLEEVRTTANTTDGPVIRQSPKLFDWAEDGSATVTPTPVALVAPAARALRDFSALRSKNRNPWGSLSRRHRRSQPCTRNPFYSCQYNTNYLHKPTPPLLPPAPIQCQHIHMSHSPLFVQICLCSHLMPLPWTGMETHFSRVWLGFLRLWVGQETTARRGRRFVRGGHMEWWIPGWDHVTCPTPHCR